MELYVRRHKEYQYHCQTDMHKGSIHLTKLFPEFLLSVYEALYKHWVKFLKFSLAIYDSHSPIYLLIHSFFSPFY